MEFGKFHEAEKFKKGVSCVVENSQYTVKNIQKEKGIHKYIMSARVATDGKNLRGLQKSLYDIVVVLFLEKNKTKHWVHITLIKRTLHVSHLSHLPTDNQPIKAKC